MYTHRSSIQRENTDGTSPCYEHYTMSNPYSIILAPNPSIMTGPGTNTIIVDGGDTKGSGATVIDPADDSPEHLSAIIYEGVLRGGICRILLTQTRKDANGGYFVEPAVHAAGNNSNASTTRCSHLRLQPQWHPFY